MIALVSVFMVIMSTVAVIVIVAAAGARFKDVEVTQGVRGPVLVSGGNPCCPRGPV